MTKSEKHFNNVLLFTLLLTLGVVYNSSVYSCCGKSKGLLANGESSHCDFSLLIRSLVYLRFWTIAVEMCRKCSLFKIPSNSSLLVF